MRRPSTIAVALAAAALCAALAEPGCKGGPDLRALCDSAQRCIGGNDKDVDACVDQNQLAQKTADIRGCRDEFDTYATCVVDNGACTDLPLQYGCQTDADCHAAGFGTCSNGRCSTKTYAPASGTCKAEKAAYVSCNGGLGALQ
jgi:hypothetical protein